MTAALLLIGHGSVESIAQLPEFLTSIRHGRPPDAALLAEVERRYQAIGGRSPLLDIQARLARKLEARLQIPVAMAGRHGSPKLEGVLDSLLSQGVDELTVLPMAQHSAPIYLRAVREALAERGSALRLREIGNWGQRPALLALFAERVRAALAVAPAQTRVLMSAHSLPVQVVRAGDPYEQEVRAAATAIAERAEVQAAQIVFQSQGLSTGPGGRVIEWLGPDLPAAIEQARAEGARHVLVAPVGFLSDHIEILYDLDLEARALTEPLGLGFSRTESLNDDDAFVEILCALVGEARA